MKKIFIGSFAAICTAVGFSFFRPINTMGPYLFKINSGVNQPSNITGAVLLPNQVTYIASVGAANCSTGFGFDEVVTFATIALTSGHQRLAGRIPVSIRRTICTRGFN
jgi:hypothetical protein